VLGLFAACERLTPPQADLLEGFADEGGRLLVLGDLGSNLGRRMEALVRRDGVLRAEPFRFSLDMLPFGPQVHVVDGLTDLGVSLHRVEGGTVGTLASTGGIPAPQHGHQQLEVRLGLHAGERLIEDVEDRG
jgi:hypothetical protein